MFSNSPGKGSKTFENKETFVFCLIQWIQEPLKFSEYLETFPRTIDETVKNNNENYILGGKTESWFMLCYPAIDLMISSLCCNFENIRTKTKIIHELELNKN